MNTSQQAKQSNAMIPALLLALLFSFVNCGYAWDYGNGRHGSYVLTTNATVEQLYQTVRLPSDPAQYNPTDSNAIPNFQILIITNGATLTANPWNGSTGGSVFLKVQSTLSIATGSAISVSGEGYRGGGQVFLSQSAAGVQGESYAGSQTASGGANYGGGGGSFAWSISNGHPNYTGPGAGGGYGGNGAAVGNGFCACGPTGGGTYGTPSIDTAYLGSGGGGSADSGYSMGGNGGGAIVIISGSINLGGQIHADGNAGGGGGSGGSIKLQVATANLGTNQVTANGGSGVASGGVGRIAINYAENFTGITAPTAYTLYDTNSDNVTVITNQPAPQISFLGSNVVFSVGVSGFTPLFFQWNFNNTPILGATNQTLSLVNLAFTNQGNFSVAISNVVGTVVSSNAYLTVLDPRSPFVDGIPNWWKTQYGLSLIDPSIATNYPSSDKLTYLEKYLYGLNPLTNDTDGDGLTDYDEIFIYHTNPLLPDTDGDGVPDGWEVQHGLNPLVNDATQIGLDGVSNLQIYQYDMTNSTQLDPRNPFFASGTSIYEALNNGQHTNRFYYDHEDRLVGVESSRGISIAYIYDGNGNPKRQTVLSRANETNGLPVLWQFLNGLTNGTTASGPYGDPDGDGWSNYQEWKAGTDPNGLQSVPSLLNNPGTNIASLAFPFTPSNCVMAAGQLNGVAGDEIVLGADGNATGKTNSLFILTQGASSWQVQQLPVGAFGITSVAIGQPTNRLSPAIYVGLRQMGGSGAIWELFQTNGLWQTNVLAVSTNQAAYVLGVRSTDVLCSFATNGQDCALYSLTYSAGIWNQSVISTNSSHRGLGTHGSIFAQHNKDSSLRLLDTGGIEINGGSLEVYMNGIQLPPTPIEDTNTGNWLFESTNQLAWTDAESFAQSYGGNLVTVSSVADNTWIASQFSTPYWIGLYFEFPSSGGSIFSLRGNWISSGQSPTLLPDQGFYSGLWVYSNPYQNFDYTPPYIYPQTNGVVVGNLYPYGSTWSLARVTDGFRAVMEFVGAVPFTNQWLIPEPSVTSRFQTRGISLAAGLPRPSQTNSTSMFYVFADDLNQSGKLDVGDNFTLAEYLVSGNTWTTNTLLQVPVASASVAQSFSLAAVNFNGTGKDTFFTGEPDGRIYSWTGIDAINPLKRQLFSDAYVGTAWQAMCGVQMPAIGKGLAGLMIDPTNQNVCNVIFWSPQAVLPTPQPSLVETAPSAAVIPSVNPLGSNAVVTIRLWDNEGNTSTPFLQYQILGASTWQNATLTVLDGAFYNPATRVTALPTGNNHTLGWNALADLGGNIVTNVLLRTRAQDFMLMGDWSVPTPFQLNTTITTSSNPTNPPVVFTGITRVQGGIGFNWQGSTNAWLYLQRSPALAGTNAVWVNIWTGAPPTLYFGSYTDFFGTNSMGFYRMKIVSP